MDQSPSNPMGGLSEGCKAVRQAMITVCNQRAEAIAEAENAKSAEDREDAFRRIRYYGALLADLDGAHKMVLDHFQRLAA